MDNSSPKKRKKGDRHPENYKRNIIKSKRIHGEEYTDYGGNVKQAKRVRSPCRCRRQCFKKFDEVDKGMIFDYVYQLETKDAQDLHLQRMIHVEEVKQHRPRKEEAVLKDRHFRYHVLLNDEQVEVCRKAYFKLYDITDKRVRRLRMLLLQGKSPHDKRGQNISGNRIKSDEVFKVHEHIASFPVSDGHYRDVKYLSEELSVTKMYELFKIKFPESGITYSFYNKYFKENFTLRFGRPATDVCNFCEEKGTRLRNPNLNDHAKRVEAAELIVHKRRAKRFYKALKESTEQAENNEHILGLVFDFMQNLELPKIPVQDAYYLRHLTVNVFAVCNLKTRHTQFYIYHEGVARKGANEVSSYLIDYIKTYVPDTVTELHIFSDNCPGQNKNHTFTRVMLNLTDTGRFKKIRQFFPLRGHSFLSCDRTFSIIKRPIKRSSRIYTVKQLCELIIATDSRRNTINIVETEQIIDYDNWWPALYKKIVFSIETAGRPYKEREQFSISKYHYFEYNSERKGAILTSEYIHTLCSTDNLGYYYNTFLLLKENDYNVYKPSIPAYPAGRLPIKKAKKEDIKKAMKVAGLTAAGTDQTPDENVPRVAGLIAAGTDQTAGENVPSGSQSQMDKQDVLDRFFASGVQSEVDKEADLDRFFASGTQPQVDKQAEVDRLLPRSQIATDDPGKGLQADFRTRMPELDEEGRQSTSEEQVDEEDKKSTSDSIDYAKAFGRWRKMPHYCWGVSRGFWVAGEKDKKHGVPFDDTTLVGGIRPNWKPRPLVPVGTENPDYKHTIEDIVKSACILSSPPRKVRFEDEEDMRRVYSLIYDVFRYKNVMTEILHDGKFFQQYPSLIGYENLVMLMLYDLYKRYFTPRPNNNGELNGVPRLKDIHQALAEARIHVAASFGRIRIKNQVCSLTDILPERLKDEKVVALEKSLATAWVNTSKARYTNVDRLIESTGLTHKYEWAVAWQKCDYRMDHLCPKFFMCDPASRGKLLNSEPVKNGRIVVQDRSFCLAPALLNKALLDFDLTGKVVQTHMNSPRTTAYLANLLSENCKLDGLIVFGAEERKEEVEEYLRKLEIKNTTVIAERFINISPDSELLKVVSAVLANPPNTYSGVLDPVDLVCSRGGDMEMLELLTESETDRQRVMDILDEQKQTLRIAMCRPQIQLVMYETHSIVQAENNNMVIKLVNEMNQIAYERYLEEQSKLSKSAKSEEEARDTETVLKEETPDSKEEKTTTKEEGEDQEKAEIKNEENEEEILLKTTDATSEVDAEGAASIDYSEDAIQANEEDVLAEKVELKTYEDVEVPPCDLFEIGELPDLCPHKSSCLDLKEEGCYIALLKRKLVQSWRQKRLAREKELEEQRKKEAADSKELVSLDAKYMISVAEMRGLFGGGPKKTPSGRGYRRRELMSMRSGSGSSGASQKARGRAAKIDLERLTAPTVASMLRTAGFEPSEDSVFVHSHRRSRSDDSSAEALSLRSDEAKPKPTFAQQQAAMRRLSAPLTRRIVSKVKVESSNEEMEYADVKKVNEKDDNDADIMYGDDDIEFSDLSPSRKQKQPTMRSMAARKKELEKEYVSFMETKSKKQWQGTSVARKASKSPDNLRNINKTAAAGNIDEIYKKEDFRESMEILSPKQTRYTTSIKQTQEEKSDIKNMDVRQREMEKEYISLLEGTTENMFNELRSGLEGRSENVSSLSMRSWQNCREYGKFSEAMTPLVQLLKSKIEILKGEREKEKSRRREIYDDEDRICAATLSWPTCVRSVMFDDFSNLGASDYSISDTEK